MTLSLSVQRLRRVPFELSSAWLRAFETQCTKDLVKKANRFAERRARMLSLVGGAVDDYYPRELVQDVLADTTLGILRWDPGSERLEDHVMDAIATRVHHDVVHAQRFPHVPLDATDPDASPVTTAAAAARLLSDREASCATVRLAEDAYSELWEQAAADPDLRQLLQALADGATCKADVMFMTGLSDQDYHAARNRLYRLIGRLPPHARPSRARPRKA